MNAPLFPSGDIVSGAAPRCVPCEVAAGGDAVHAVPCRSQVYRRAPTTPMMDFPSGVNSKFVNGSVSASYFPPAVAENAAATFVWSKARVRVFFTGSTMTNSLPPGIAFRYQNRPSGSQVGRTPALKTRE